MNIPHNTRYIIIGFSNVIIIFVILATTDFLARDTYSVSPSFVRQEISDAPLDVVDQNLRGEYSGGRFVNCSKILLDPDVDVPSIEIGSVSYMSDGRTINSTIWLKTPIG